MRNYASFRGNWSVVPDGFECLSVPPGFRLIKPLRVFQDRAVLARFILAIWKVTELLRMRLSSNVVCTLALLYYL